MFQIGLDLETDTQVTHWYVDVFRAFMAMFDRAVYSLLMILYEVFFNIADATIISSDTVRNFYSRVQLIIGVFMIFKVSVSLLQAVINPDRLTDKEAGMGKLISRIIMMLAMFAAIIPLNIPYAEEGTYNAYLNENGLLFGTLYSLQARIIDQNVLGKLIVGNVSTNQTSEGSIGSTAQSSGIDKEKSARTLATFVLKTFVRINIKKDATEAGATDPSNYMCTSGWGNDYVTYTDPNSTPNDILNNINDWCTGPNGEDDNYSFVYTPFISTACGIVIVIILLGFCVDIAVRALKLAVLRLISPIPIISYIDPKSSKDGAFASWVKALVSTYVDLFIRLAIIFFVLFIVQEIMENGLGIPVASGPIGLVSTVFIIIGLFYFARMAPKFLKDSLGLKGNFSNFGLSGMLAAAGAVRTGGGFRDALAAARNSADTQVAAYNQGKQAPGIMQNFQSGQDYMAQELTGNEKMTYRQMKRGERYLDREGLTTGRVEQAKNKMYELKDAAEISKATVDKLNNGMNWNDLSDAEKDRIGFDDAVVQYKMDHGMDSTDNLTDEQMNQIAQDQAVKSYIAANTAAGRQESLYNDMQKEMDRRGGSRNSYRAKHGDLRDIHAAERDVRFGDLFSRDGRADVFGSEGIRQGLRNVASMPRNARLRRSDERNANIDNQIREDQRGAEVTNNNIRRRRGP